MRLLCDFSFRSFFACTDLRPLRTLTKRSGLALAFSLLSLCFSLSPSHAGLDAGHARELISVFGFSPDHVGFAVAPVDHPNVSGDAQPSNSPALLFNADAQFIPASTIKIATALVADTVLGGQYRFATELYRDGPVQDGVLVGNLILRGGGDPRLEPEHLLELAMAARRLGIRRIDGHILVDDTWLPRAPLVNADQPDDAYNAGVGALMVGFNRVTLHWQEGRAFAIPPLQEARIDIAPRANGKATIIDRQAAGDGFHWRIKPMRQSGRQALPVADAGLHAASLFARFLEDQGIEPAALRRGAVAADAVLISRHRGPELRSILRDMLHYSNNQIAETVGLAAARAGGAALSAAGPRALADAARFSRNLIQTSIPAIDWSGIVMNNHSGLEPEGRISPRQLAAILSYSHGRLDLPALLPAAAYSGTLARRFVDERTAFRVWAKTGTVFYGSAIAGYLLPERGEPLSFVIMVTDEARRRAFDAEPDRHLELAPAARDWSTRARGLQDALIEAWLR